MPVALAARRLDRLNELVTRITAHGGRALAFELDVSDSAACCTFISRTIDAFGSIYGVFANAGYGVERSVLLQPDSELRAVFETNFFGSLNVIRPAAAAMLRSTPDAAGARGHILLCSSCVSKIGLPCYASYSASKALQDHFGRALRVELGPSGIHASTVHPIGTQTEFFATSERLSGGKKISIQTPERYKQPVDVVARAIETCLRRPRGEVWTSFPMRAALALATIAPELADRILRRRMRGRLPDPLAHTRSDA